MAKDLSILIPARNEMWLARTVQDILENIEMDTEIIVVLDGAWADPGIPQHERVKVIYVPTALGQRAATNLACSLSEATYVMKTDAHCAFDKGFDRKMIEHMQDDWTMVPAMRNLHAFDWVCPDAKPGDYPWPKGQSDPHRRYQSPSGPCKTCGKETIRDVRWIAKIKPLSTSYSFDSEPHFQYHNEYKKRDAYKEDLKDGLTESMSIQGSCFLLTRKAYWELNISDEAFGSWGSQGIEVACKTWLSGGKVIINHHTWYAHLFRTQGGDFGFPYEQDEKQIQRAKAYARKMFFDGEWPLMKKPLSWLVEKFMPITPSEKNRGWTEEELDKLKANNN